MEKIQMLNNDKYVVQSLELHLFFARIMKEHSIFLEAGFTPRDADFAKKADFYKQRFEMILLNTVQVSGGVVSNEVLSSGEIITDFTLGTERKTQNFTGISINQNITVMESKLRSGNIRITRDLVNYVRQLNSYAKSSIKGLIEFKESILNNMLSCNMFTQNYPLQIEHILHEARLYQTYVEDLDNGADLDNIDIRQTELFWDQDMMEHALFIRGLLDPTEGKLINTANDFASDYSDLLEYAKEATDITINSITDETLKKTEEYRDFKASGTQGISECKIRSIIVPLLADHVLREANHYIRLLKVSIK